VRAGVGLAALLDFLKGHDADVADEGVERRDGLLPGLRGHDDGQAQVRAILRLGQVAQRLELVGAAHHGAYAALRNDQLRRVGAQRVVQRHGQHGLRVARVLGYAPLGAVHRIEAHHGAPIDAERA
jgi:hypothetical protein